MANISTETIRLKSGKDFARVIKYSKGKFYCALPEELCNDLLYKEDKDKKVTGNTEDEVKGLFRDKLLEWQNAQTESIKVIIFESKFQGALARKSFAHKWRNGYTPCYPQNGISSESELWEFHNDDLHQQSAIGMTIKWAVYTKETFKEKHKYTFVSGRPFSMYDLSNNWSAFVEIDWTEARERFFLELDESFANMINKVYKALGDLTPEKLAFLAESKMKLLGQ